MGLSFDNKYAISVVNSNGNALISKLSQAKLKVRHFKNLFPIIFSYFSEKVVKNYLYIHEATRKTLFYHRYQAVT